MIRAIDNRCLQNTYEKHLALSCGTENCKTELVKMMTHIFIKNSIFFNTVSFALFSSEKTY